MNSNRSRSNPPPVEQLPAAQRDTNEREYRQYQRERSFMLNEMNTAKRTTQNEDERSTLMRRLRAVESENQQLHHDRNLTLQQLHEERLRNEELLRKAKHSSQVKSVVDRNALGDLRYEKEENNRLRALVHSLEVERAELRARLKEYEGASSNFVYERQDLTAKLQQRVDHIAILESDNRVLVDRVNTLQVKLAQIETEHRQVHLERAALNETAMRLEGEVAELVDRAHEEATRFDHFQVAKTNELGNLKWAHRRQVRLFATRLLFNGVLSYAQKQVNGALCTLATNTALNKAQSAGSKRVALYTRKWLHFTTAQYFARWKMQLNWLGTNRIRSNMVQSHYTRALQAKVFADWRAAFHCKLRRRHNQVMAISILFKHFEGNRQNSLRARFLIWRNTYDFIYNRDWRFQRGIKQAVVGKLRSALQKWKGFKHWSLATQAREDLASDVAGLLLKATYFKAFKEFATLQRMSRAFSGFQDRMADKLLQMNVLNRFKRYTHQQRNKDGAVRRLVRRWVHNDLAKGFRTWTRGISQAKRNEKLTRFILSKNYSLCALNKDKLFYVWKWWVSSGKCRGLASELSDERPQRIALEAQVNHLLGEGLRKSQIKAGRAIAKQLHCGVYSYFSHWKCLTNAYPVALRLVFRLLRKQCAGMLSVGFAYWKKQVKDIDVLTLCQKVEMTLAQSQQLAEHVNFLEGEVGVRDDHRSGTAGKALRRALISVTNKDQLGGLRRWARNALQIANIDFGGHTAEKRLRRLLFRLGFNNIQLRARAALKQERRRTRLQHYLALKLMTTHRKVFEAWLQFVDGRNQFKRKVLIAAKHKGFRLAQLAMGAWRRNVSGVANSLQAEHTQRVMDEKDSLNHSLLELTTEFQDTSRLLTKAQKTLTKNCHKRLKNALCLCLNRSKAYSFGKWKGAVHQQQRQLSQTGKLLRIVGRRWLRGSWRQWVGFVKQDIQDRSLTEIRRLHDNSKQSTREFKAKLNSLQSHVEEQDLNIQQYQAAVDKTKRRNRFLVTRGIQQMQTDYSQNRAAFVFMAWKERFLVMKARLYRFAHLMRVAGKRGAVRKIKAAANETLKLINVQDLLFGLCRKYSFRFMRNLFDRWSHNSHSLAQVQLEKALQREMQAAADLRHHTKLVQAKNCQKFLLVLTQRKKTSLFHGWARMARKLKAIRRASYRFCIARSHLRLNWALGKMLDFKTARLQRTHQSKRSAVHYSGSLVKSVFLGWRQWHQKLAYLKQTFTSLWKRHYRDTLNGALAAMQVQHAFKSTHLTWHAKSKQAALGKCLRRCNFKLQAKGMNSWTAFMQKKESGQGLLRKVMLGALHRKFRRAFQLWEESSLVASVTLYTNTKGHVAVQNESLKNRVAILDRLIKEEGIDPKYVEQYILEKERGIDALRVKQLERLRHAHGGPDHRLLPRVFLLWKMWTLKRKRIQRVCHRMQAFRRKGAELHAFTTWKRGLPLVVNAIKGFTRQQLHGLVARMDRDIKTLEGRLEVSHKDVVYLQTYCSILEVQTRRGQNQALLFCSRNVTCTLQRGLMRWVLHTQLSKVHDILQALTQLEEEHLELKAYCRSIEEEGKTMVEENMELRQASLDGIAIADAFETLTKERERLSVDLADRAATIKRLLEENHALSSKLKQVEEFDHTRHLR